MAALAFVVYAFCAAPTVTYGGDCGELIAASYRLGIAHPTGYPLYLLLGRTFASLVPFGEVAWRYNVLSALLGAAAIGFIVALVHRLISAGDSGQAYASGGEKRYRLLAAGGAGALLAGFSYFSSQSTIAEVYALNALMLSALLYCAVAWHQSGAPAHDVEPGETTPGGDLRWAYTCAALAGLALNAHLSCIFLAPGFLLYVLAQHRARFIAQGGFGRHLLRMGLLFCAAYALTLYMPLRAGAFPAVSAQDLANSTWPPLDWTHPATFKQWLAHVSAKQYKHLLWQPYEVSLAGLTFHINWFVQPLAKSLSKFSVFSLFVLIQFFWSVPFLFVGAWTCWNNNAGSRRAAGGRWLGLLLGLAFIFNVALEINYTVGDMQNFFFPAYMVIAIWLGLGISRTMTFIHRLITPKEEVAAAAQGQRRHLTPLQRVTTLMVFWLASTVFLQWSWSGPSLMQRGETEPRENALRRAGVVENLQRSSGRTPNVVLMNDDQLWTFWYARYVLGRAPICTTPWGPGRNKMFDDGRMKEMVAEWQKTGPVIMTKWDEQLDRKSPYEILSPEGDLCLLSDRILPPPATPLKAMPAGTPDYKVVKAAFHGPLQAHSLEFENKQRYRRVQRSDMAALYVDFALRSAQPLSAAAAGGMTIDKGRAAMHIGFVEVYMALNGRHREITPTQADEQIETPMSPPIVGWRQSRRLVVPLSYSAKRPQSTLLQAAAPLQIEADAQLGRYNVWVRLVRSRDDKVTAWTRVEDVILK